MAIGNWREGKREREREIERKRKREREREIKRKRKRERDKEREIVRDRQRDQGRERESEESMKNHGALEDISSENFYSIITRSSIFCDICLFLS